MLPPSNVLFSLVSLIVVVQLSCLTLSGRVVAAKTGATVALLSVPLFSSGLGAFAQKDSGRFIKQKWCPWSPWSRCSPEPCIAGIQPALPELFYYRTDEPFISPKSKRGAAVDEERLVHHEDTANYCVVKPDSSSNRNVYPLLVQTTLDGVIKRREPAKQRVRRCHCRSLSLWQLIGIHREDECLLNSIQIECGQCGLNENVYQTRQFEFDESVLPFCDLSATGSVQLYKIIGGVAGAIIVIISIVWLIRMLVRTVCRSSSSSARSAGGRAGVRRNDRDRGSQNSTRGRDARSCRSRSSTNDLSDPLQMTTPIFNDSELPPAYKDVVSGLPGVLFVGPGSYVEVDHGEEPASPTNRFGHRLCKPRSGRFRGHGSRRDQSNRNSTNNDNNNIVDNTPEQVASSSQMVSPRRSSTPPPPSYEDVMSLPVLQSGADECAHVVDVAETGITTVSSSNVTDVQPHAEEIANVDALVDNHHSGLMDTSAGRCSDNNPAGSAATQHSGSSSPQTSDNVPPSAVHSDHVYLPHSITEATVNPPGQLAG